MQKKTGGEYYVSRFKLVFAATFILIYCNILALAQNVGTAISVAVAQPTAVDKIISAFPNLLPVGIFVAVIGYFGTVYSKKTDRRISEESSYVKIFESVIKDNATLRTDKDKLQSELNSKLSELAMCQATCRMAERDAEEYKETIEDLEKDLKIAQELVSSLKKKEENYRRVHSAVREKIIKLGVSEFDIAIIFGDSAETNEKDG